MSELVFQGEVESFAVKKSKIVKADGTEHREERMQVVLSIPMHPKNAEKLPALAAIKEEPINIQLIPIQIGLGDDKTSVSVSVEKVS